MFPARVPTSTFLSSGPEGLALNLKAAPGSA